MSCVVLEGIPADTIIRYAADHAADLIIMSSHGKSGLSHYITGSVADKVTHYSTVPVLITLPKGCDAVLKEKKLVEVKRRFTDLDENCALNKPSSRI